MTQFFQFFAETINQLISKLLMQWKQIKDILLSAAGGLSFLSFIWKLRKLKNPRNPVNPVEKKSFLFVQMSQEQKMIGKLSTDRISTDIVN